MTALALIAAFIAGAGFKALVDRHSRRLHDAAIDDTIWDLR